MKKYNKIIALILLISVLFAFLPVYMPVYSANIAGSIASFELADDNTGKNVIGTILNKSQSKDIASENNPFVCTRLNFAKVKIYVDGGDTVEWENFYWRASSLNNNTAEVVGENKTDGVQTPIHEDIYSSNYFVRLDIKSTGTTVITVEVSASHDMSNSLIKTFTVKVIDDSADGEVKAIFQKNTGAVLDLNYALKINMTDTMTAINISSLIGYDYSNLNSSNEKILTSYTWKAEVLNKTGNALISSKYDGTYSDKIHSEVDNDTGNKTIYIKPVNNGAVDIIFTFIPAAIYNDKYSVSTQTLRLNISQVLGNIEFNPVSEIYGANAQPENIRVKIENLRVLINGEYKNINELVENNNASLTAYVTVPKNKISGDVIIDDINSMWETNPANTNELRCSVDMSLNFLQNPYIYVPLIENAGVKIEISGYIFNELKSVTKTADIKFISEADNGKISSFNFKSDGNIVEPGKTLNIKIDKDGKMEKNIILYDFEAEVFDSNNSSSGFKGLLSQFEYEIKAEADKVGIVNISLDNDSKIINITPVKSGSVKIKITAEKNDGSSSFAVLFNITVTNIGILPEDEGKILSVELKRDNKNQKIYTGENQIIYLKDGIDNYNALTVNIDKIIVSAANKPSSGYKDELKIYQWEISQDYPGYYGEILSIEKTSGNTENGESEIKMGTDKINGETGKININIKITPGVKLYHDNGEEYYEYNKNKTAEVSFKIIVNEIGGKFMPEIDYDRERIYILNSKMGDDKSYYYFNGEPEYMYCLRAADDGVNQSFDRWMPFMGSYIDIGKLIPKSGTSPFRIAIKAIDSEPEEDGNYSSDSRKLINLYPRRTLTVAERRAVVYKDEMIIYNNMLEKPEKVLYKVGLSDYVKGEINNFYGINVPTKSNPLGNTVTVKFAAVTDYENPENSRFASVEFKINVPKPGKMPVIRDDKKKKFSGFTDKMLWSATGEADSWESCGKSPVLYEDLSSVFPGLETDSSDEFYILYVKTAATLKIPESDVLILKIPADKYE